MNCNYVERESPLGGFVWFSNNTYDFGDGFDLMTEFIEKYKHEDWDISIFDTQSSSIVTVHCEFHDIPNVVSLIYHKECSDIIEFIGENILTHAYIVSMPFRKNAINRDYDYVFKKGRLIKACRKKL